MQLMVRNEVELLLLLSKVNSLELHLLLLRKVQLKLLLGLQGLHLGLLLWTPKTLLQQIHSLRVEHRLAKSH